MILEKCKWILGRIARNQAGAILPLAIITSFLGLALVVPTAVLVGTAALRQGDFEDKTRDFYLTDSVIMAVISDLQRGADGDPVAPGDYIPPTVRFGDSVPNITVLSLDAFLASLTDPVTGKPLGSQTVSTTRMVTYEAGDQPVASVGAITVGGVTELKEDDGDYFRVTAPSQSSTTFSYEVTSEPIGFSNVQFGEVKLKVRGWEESTTVEVFVFNPDDPASGSDGYRLLPNASNLLDHQHALDDELPEKHKHDDDHEREAHSHDGLHFHGKDADKIHDHKDHHALNLDDAFDDHHHDGQDDHHGHHDDEDHEEDEGHGHHGHKSHDHHHDKGKNTDHHHYKDTLGDLDHLLVHNHPDDHKHHGHGKKHHHHHGHKDKHDHHHGEEALSFFLSANDLAYLNSIPLPGDPSLPQGGGPVTPKVLKIKVKSTVFFDPDHHHHVKKHDDPDAVEKDKEGEDEEGKDEKEKEGKSKAHDHIHHSNRLNPPLFSLETDQILFELGGTATTDQRQLAGAPVITLGKGTPVVPWGTGDMILDDNASFSIRSGKVPKAFDDEDDDGKEFDDDKKDFTHVVEFEAESDDFAFSRIDTISVPIVLQTSETKKAKVRIFVFNPDDPGHNPITGYNTVPDLVKEIRAPNKDRAFALQVPQEDIDRLNDLSPISIKVKVRVSLNKEFVLKLDRLVFVATTTDVQTQAVRTGIQEFVDPGLRDPDMAVMPHKTGYLLRVNNLQPGVMNVNWAFEPHVDDPSTCSGVTRIVLEYTGTDPVNIQVFLKNRHLDTFVRVKDGGLLVNTDDLLVNTGDLLEIDATEETDGKLHSEIELLVDGEEEVEIHTSCSKPIAIGHVHGEFVIDDLDTLPGNKPHKHKHHHDDKKDISIEVYRGLVVGKPTSDHEHEDDDEDKDKDEDKEEGKVAINPGRITKEIKTKDNTLVVQAHVHAHHGASSVSTGFFEVDTGIYTVVYFNDDKEHGGGKDGKFTVVSKPFAAPGPGSEADFGQSTGFYASVYKDYVIFAESEKVSLKAVVRQVPGPTDNSFGRWATDNIAWSKNLVLIQSWGEPADVAPLVVDLDGDGVLDEVDGQFTDGAFVDQSAVETSGYTDQHRGGVTFGTIVDSAGIDVRVRDLNNPDDGVLIWATGQGDAVATLNLCGNQIVFFSIGDVVKETCGSLILEVIEGPVEIPLAG